MTIMVACPMNLLPCREALLEVIDVSFHQTHHRSDRASHQEECCWRFFRRYNSFETVGDAEITTEDELVEIVPSSEGHIQAHEEIDQCAAPLPSSTLIRHDPIQSDYVFRNAVAHYGSTLLIAAACYLGAVSVKGVATVWSFIGSSMAFVIAFVLPCGCFVVIEGAVPRAAEGGDRQSAWLWMAWAILPLSVVGAVVCTVNSVVGQG